MKVIRNENAFTLIEMMIVLLIISILLLIAVPNIGKNTSVANSKGCDATVHLLNAQIGAYEIEHGKAPSSLKELDGYVNTTDCPDGTKLIYDATKKKVEKVTNE